ncbi:tetratricopeptide repeat protein, partial [Candidatus Bathyarchaeota archaeon]|nr:tetratricopeptide repeat protein [Candidatus Bathyarchaeota archaeon]
RAFEIASELEKDDPSIWRNLGLARKNCGDLEGAINAFKVALDLDPENVGLILQLGDIYRDGGEGTAIEYYEKAIEIEPNNGQAYVNLGVYYITVEPIDYEEAIKIFQKGLNNTNEGYHAILHYNIACAYALGFMNSGYVANALNHLKQAILMDAHFRKQAEGDPDFDGIRDIQGFKALMNLHLNEFITDVEGWLNLAAGCFKYGDYKGSVIASKNALEMNQEHVHALLILGISLMNSGDMQGAKNELRKAVDVDPGNIESWKWFSKVETEPILRSKILLEGLKHNPNDESLRSILYELIEEIPDIEEREKIKRLMDE